VNPDELAELEEQRGFLVRSLDDLERELGAGDIDALDATTLRDDYTHRLGDVQRAIESGHVAIAEQSSPRRPGRTIAAVVIVAALAVGAGVAVAHTAGSRKPGESATGNIRDNTNNQLSEAAGLAQQGKFAEALKDYDAVLATDPRNVEALSEKGLLLASLAGPAESEQFLSDGETSVRKALAVEPTNARALFYLGLILRLEGDTKGAVQAFDAALANHPTDALRAQIEQFRTSTGE